MSTHAWSRSRPSARRRTRTHRCRLEPEAGQHPRHVARRRTSMGCGRRRSSSARPAARRDFRTEVARSRGRRATTPHDHRGRASHEALEGRTHRPCRALSRCRRTTRPSQPPHRATLSRPLKTLARSVVPIRGPRASCRPEGKRSSAFDAFSKSFVSCVHHANAPDERQDGDRCSCALDVARSAAQRRTTQVSSWPESESRSPGARTGTMRSIEAAETSEHRPAQLWGRYCAPLDLNGERYHSVLRGGLAGPTTTWRAWWAFDTRALRPRNSHPSPLEPEAALVRCRRRHRLDQRRSGRKPLTRARRPAG